MKKLWSIIVLIVLMASTSWGLKSSTILVSEYQFAVDYARIWVPYTISDTTNIAEVYLYLAISPSYPALYDSINSSFTKPDTFKITGLMNGATYRFMIGMLDTTAIESTMIYSPIFSRTTTDYTQTVGDSGVSFTSAWCYWDSSAADTGLAKLELVYGLTNPPTTKVEVATATIRQDTMYQLTSLMSGATYYYYFIATDSATTDSSVIGSFTTIDWYPTITTLYASNDSLIISYDTTTGHTMGDPWRTYLQINTAYNVAIRCWTAYDSIINQTWLDETGDTLVGDTLWTDSLGGYANPVLILGKRGIVYNYRFITYDSLGATDFVVDTSTTLTYTFPDYPFMKLSAGYGTSGAHVERGKLIINKTGDSPMTGYIPIAGYDWLHIKVKMTGQDNATIKGSGNGDTISLYLGCAGMEGNVKIDSLIDAITTDSSELVLKSYCLHDTARTDASLANMWSDYLILWTNISDSLTFGDSVLNQRIINYCIELK